MRNKSLFADILAHIRNKGIHNSGSAISALTENYTYRGNASNTAVATNVLKTFTNHVEVTNDHPLAASAALVMVVPIAFGDAEPTASGFPIGTLLPIYMP